MRSRRLVAGCVACTLALATSAVAQTSSGEFTDGERARLMAGELVTRNISRREGGNHLFGGASWQRVHAPIDRVWQIVIDPDAYVRLIPSLDQARVIEDRGDSRVVYMHHSYAIASTSYHAIMRLDHERHELRFDLDRSRPHDVREGRGFLALSAYRGDTIVAWGMLADVGAGVVQEVFGPFLNQWLLLPPRCLRDEVEPGRTPSC